MAGLDSGPIDYTSRDFASIRDDVIAAIQGRLPEWDGTDPNDYLRVLAEGFAFVADLTNYYIDRVANEAFLPTATQRQSLLNIARTFGYSAAGPVSASCTLSLTNTGAASVTVPAGTSFLGSYNRAGAPTTITVESTDDVTIAPGATNTVSASEGRTQRGSSLVQSNGAPIGVLLYRVDGAGSSDGTPDQEFLISNGPVADGSIRVWAHPPTGDVTISDGAEYQYVSNLIDANPDDRVFTIFRDANDRVSVVFGDGASGFIPPAGTQVRAVYTIGSGEAGNVPIGTINVSGNTPTGASVPITVSVTQTTAALGGTDSEGIDSIRENALRTLRTRDRAVSLADFKDIAIRTPGISRASAIGSALSNVLVYIAPQVTAADTSPGYTEINLRVVNKVLSSNVATLTTATNHGLVVGQVVHVLNVGVPFDGAWVVSSTPNSNVFTYAVAYANVTTAACNGLLFSTGNETDSFASLLQASSVTLAEVAPAGTGVSVSGPTYADVSVRMTVQLEANMRQTAATSSVTSSVLGAFSAMERDFAETIYNSDVLAAVSAVPGVRNAQVTTLTRSTTYASNAATYLSSSPPTNIYDQDDKVLIGAPNEIFRLLPQNLVVTVLGGITA